MKSKNKKYREKVKKQVASHNEKLLRLEKERKERKRVDEIFRRRAKKEIVFPLLEEVMQKENQLKE